MKKCYLCKEKIHKDDLTSVTTPMDGVITEVCPTCIEKLDFVFSMEVAKIQDQAKNKGKTK